MGPCFTTGLRHVMVSLERGEIKDIPAKRKKLRERPGIAITHVNHQLNDRCIMTGMIVRILHGYKLTDYLPGMPVTTMNGSLKIISIDIAYLSWIARKQFKSQHD
jgi:hypothetical protein